MPKAPARSEGNFPRDVRPILERFDREVAQRRLPRDEIIASWQRCVLAGVDSEHFVVPYDPGIDDGDRLNWAAGPIIERVGRDLEDTRIGLLLSDPQAHIVASRAGDKAT